MSNIASVLKEEVARVARKELRAETEKFKKAGGWERGKPVPDCWSWGLFLIPRTIGLLLLSVVSSNAAAEWAEVGKAGAATVYADRGTISRKGNMVKMSSLLDFSTAPSINNTPPFLSIKTLVEYDCTVAVARVLVMNTYPDRMGKGDVLEDDSTPRTWKSRSDGGVGAALYRIACGKR